MEAAGLSSRRVLLLPTGTVRVPVCGLTMAIRKAAPVTPVAQIFGMLHSYFVHCLLRDILSIV